MWEWTYLFYLLIIPIVYVVGFVSLVPLYIWAKWYMEDTVHENNKFHISCVVLGILVMGFMYWLETQGMSISNLFGYFKKW